MITWTPNPQETQWIANIESHRNLMLSNIHFGDIDLFTSPWFPTPTWLHLNKQPINYKYHNAPGLGGGGGGGGRHHSLIDQSRASEVDTQCHGKNLKPHWSLRRLACPHLGARQGARWDAQALYVSEDLQVVDKRGTILPQFPSQMFSGENFLRDSHCSCYASTISLSVLWESSLFSVCRWVDWLKQ